MHCYKTSSSPTQHAFLGTVRVSSTSNRAIVLLGPWLAPFASAIEWVSSSCITCFHGKSLSNWGLDLLLWPSTTFETKRKRPSTAFITALLTDSLAIQDSGIHQSIHAYPYASICAFIIPEIWPPNRAPTCQLAGLASDVQAPTNTHLLHPRILCILHPQSRPQLTSLKLAELQIIGYH